MCDNCVFSPTTKRVLEKEAGFHCGHPSCRVITIGPSNSSASRLSQVGEAAHIAAARSGGKRYDKTMTHEERSSSENGIWMCGKHAKLIDTDEKRFPTHLLLRWKRQLRHLAQRALERGSDMVPQTDLIRLNRSRRISHTTPRPDLAEFVEAFFEDIGARFVWGDEIAEGARQVLTELLFNEASHGHASWARLDSHGFAIGMTTDGAPFTVNQLSAATSGDGGQLTIGVFERAYQDTHTLNYSRPSPGRQRYLITDIRLAPRTHNPCTVSSADLWAAPAGRLGERFADCSAVHIFMSSSWTISAGNRDLLRLEPLAADTSVVLHGARGPMARALVARNKHLTIRLAP